MSGRCRAWICWPALPVSDNVLAHAPIEGIGHFYNGLLHPVFIPSHLLLLVAIGLFIGQLGPSKIEPALGAFALATIAGLILAGFSIGVEVESFILLLSSAIGLLVAVNPGLNRFVAMVPGALAGVSLGIDSAQETLSGQEMLVSLLGSGIAIYFIALYPMALADYCSRKTWQRVGVRIVGSWVAASSFLVLALTLSKKA